MGEGFHNFRPLIKKYLNLNTHEEVVDKIMCIMGIVSYVLATYMCVIISTHKSAIIADLTDDE